MEIKNQVEFDRIFREVCTQVIDDVTGLALLKIKEIVKKKVYDAYMPTSYERLGENGGLLGAWVGGIDASGGKIEGYVEHEPQMMDYVPEKLQHGNLAEGDMRDYIAMYIEQGDVHGDAGARPFWDFFVENVGTHLLDTWIRQAFVRHGLSGRRL